MNKKNSYDNFIDKKLLDGKLPDLENLSSDEKDSLLISCFKQIDIMTEKIKYLSFKAYCDILTTIALNSDELEKTGLSIEDLVFENDKKIYNRTYWETVFRPQNQNLIADCYLLDVNNLKLINDECGHKEGDSVISKTAIISSKFGTTIRLGGDEFLLIVTDKKEEFKAFLKSNHDTLPFSYGLSKKTENKPFSTVLAEADKAMYDYKKEFKKLHHLKNYKKYSITTPLEDQIRQEEKEEIEAENQNKDNQYSIFPNSVMKDEY